MLPRSFRSFAEFDREYLRESSRMGLTLEDMVEDGSFEAELDFEAEDVDDDDEY